MREAIVNGRTRVITVGIFGTLSVRVGERVLGPRDLGGVKPRRLLELLLLNDRAVTKDELIDELWGDKMPRDPIATLEAYVSVLRSSLQPGVHRDDSLIATEPGAYRLVRERADIDVDRFDSLIRLLPGTAGAERRALLMEACSYAVAPILADERYVEWTQGPRRHYERLRLEVHVAAAEAYLDEGMVGTALDLAERAVAIDRSCESAYHMAMRAAGQLGRRDMVLRFFEQCERAVRLELDSPPMPATIALRDELLDERRLVGAATGGTWSPAIEHASVDAVWPLSRFR
jgi:DNA-binding SARP family transcriptional activator